MYIHQNSTKNSSKLTLYCQRKSFKGNENTTRTHQTLCFLLSKAFLSLSTFESIFLHHFQSGSFCIISRVAHSNFNSSLSLWLKIILHPDIFQEKRKFRSLSRELRLIPRLLHWVCRWRLPQKKHTLTPSAIQKVLTLLWVHKNSFCGFWNLTQKLPETAWISRCKTLKIVHFQQVQNVLFLRTKNKNR